MKTPEDVIHQQLDAYNSKDIEGFMACWHPEAKFYEFPEKPMASGHAEIRARHVLRFTEPNLFGKLLSRTSVGNVVVDREVVTRMFDGREGRVDVIAIYEVEGGLITSARFKTGTPVYGA